MSTFDAWLNGLNLNLSNARHIDDDADGSFDCVDVAEDWCKALWPSVPVNDILGYGNAKDLYATSSGQYFDKLGANIVARPGDIPVWGATATNAFGHIAVTVNDDGTNLTDVEQNTYNQEAATIAHRTHNNIIGFLRPKVGGDMATPEDIDLAFKAVFNRPATDGEKTNPEYLGNTTFLLQTLLNNSQDARNKAANFDQIQAQLTALENQPAAQQLAAIKKIVEQ